MYKTLILLLIVSTFADAQEEPYRFQSSLSIHTIMNYGYRSFENVSRSNSDVAVYGHEAYSIDYKNFTFSAGLNWRFSLNWIENEKYSIRQTSSVYCEIYEEKINWELTDFDDSNPFYPTVQSPDNFEVGYSDESNLNGLGFGMRQELLYLRQVKEGLSIGGGLSFDIRRRSDYMKIDWSRYAPNHTALTWGRYTTKQLGVSFLLEKSYERLTVFLNLNQAILTVKRNKGGDYFSEAKNLHPISHNMDFRFPLTMQFGGALQFGRIKK